jgi:hypothetical protein
MAGEVFTFRLVFVLFGVFALGYGGVLWFLRNLVSEDDTFFHWFFFKTPYIRTAKGRKEHAEFVSKTLMAVGLFFLSIGIFPSDRILEEWGILGVGALIFQRSCPKTNFCSRCQ